MFSVVCSLTLIHSDKHFSSGPYFSVFQVFILLYRACGHNATVLVLQLIGVESLGGVWVSMATASSCLVPPAAAASALSWWQPAALHAA